MYNILKLELKSKLITLTKETIRFLKVMMIGFILIIAMLILKYKPVYEVKIANETYGYIANQENFSQEIKTMIDNVEGENIDNVLVKEEPKYTLKLIPRVEETNEQAILAKIDNDKIITYKFYSVCLNDKETVYVDTLEQATDVVEEIKSEYKGNSLELDLAISEVYTENVNEVKTNTIQVAEVSIEKHVEKLIKEKEEKEAIARINGINISAVPVSGFISSRFGESSSIRSSTHTGLDIACSTGTPIKAIAKGTVVHAGWSGPYGKLVKVSHGNGIETWYAHCSEIDVKVGDKVLAGDVISKVGTTGNSTGSHLHLEIRIDGNPVNPQKYLYKK